METEPFYKFTIPIKTQEYEPDMENGLACLLEFTYTEKYPDEPLIVSIEEPENFEEGHEERLELFLKDTMQKHIGDVMVFDLVSLAQEWLNELWDTVKLEHEQKAAKKLIEEEEAERVNILLKVASGKIRNKKSLLNVFSETL